MAKSKAIASKVATSKAIIEIVDIELSKIKVDVNQPRSEFDDEKLQELANSIKEQGLLHPITVEKIANNKFQITTGERRFRAFKLLKSRNIPCIVREFKSDEQRYAVQIVENIVREDLSPIDKAISILKYKKSRGDDTTWEDVEKELSISKSRRKQFVRLLDLPESIQNNIVANDQRSESTHITEAHARSMTMLSENEEAQFQLFNRIVDEGLTHKEAMDEARLMQNNSRTDEVSVNLPIAYDSRGELIEKLRGYADTLEGGGVLPKNSSSTKIEWTTETWNPTTGCSEKSAGCANCYAKVMANRLREMERHGYENGFEFTYQEKRLLEPIHWKDPKMIFVNSMSDIFYEDMDFNYVDRIIETIKKTRWHVYQLLTKRADKMVEYFKGGRTLPENAWLGVSVENGAREIKSRITKLRSIRAGVRFVSFEPLLGSVGPLNLKDIQWVIVGGESGPKARQMKKEWVVNIKNQCEEQGVPFFFKQWGNYNEDGEKVGKKDAGSLLDGVEYKQYPEALKSTLII